MNMENIIRHLEGVDGETMEYVLRRVGMERQMLRQLIMSMPVEEVEDLLSERREIEAYNTSFEPEEVDLFEHPELLPQRLQIVLSKIESDLTYDQCAALLSRVERMGYTFEWGLDATPYNLRPLRDE
jgi:hypothetical protein